MKKLPHTGCKACAARTDSLFCDVHANSLQAVSENKICNIYKRGQVLFHEGNHPMGLFCVQKGKVKVFKTGVDGREQIVRLAKDGDWVGYRALLGEENYSASAAAIEDSEVCFIDTDAFYGVLKSEESLRWALLKRLSQELREAENYIADMSQKSVRERAAEVLMILGKKYGYDPHDKKLLNVIMTREELANFVGTATETFIRLLSDMKEEGVVELQGRRIRIMNEQKLLEIANLDY